MTTNTTIKRGVRIAIMAALATAIAATAAVAGIYGRSRGGDPNFRAMASEATAPAVR